MPNPKENYRSAKSGKFVEKRYAKKHTATTVKEKVTKKDRKVTIFKDGGFWFAVISQRTICYHKYLNKLMEKLPTEISLFHEKAIEIASVNYRVKKK